MSNTSRAEYALRGANEDVRELSYGLEPAVRLLLLVVLDPLPICLLAASQNGELREPKGGKSGSHWIRLYDSKLKPVPTLANERKL